MPAFISSVWMRLAPQRLWSLRMRQISISKSMSI